MDEAALLEATATALAEVESSPDEPAAVRAYERALFPCACARMRLHARTMPRARLAIIPVGTQPYSPVLAALANPSDEVVLLCTKSSMRFGEEAATSIASERPIVRFADIGTGTDSVRIAQVVLGEVASMGYPPRGSVVVDVTGGRKATTAALGAVAAVRGYRQVYIEGNSIPAYPRLFAGERHVMLADVRSLASDPDRELALAALREGEFRLAAGLLERIIARSGASREDRNLLRAVEALHAWRTARFLAARAGLARARREHPGLDVPDSLFNAFAKAAAEPLGPARRALISDLLREAKMRDDQWASERLTAMLEGGRRHRGLGIVPSHLGVRLADLVERRQGR